MVFGSIQNGQESFNSDTIANIQTFENDAVDYLYDLEPQSQNLFMVANFIETSNGRQGSEIKQLYNAQFRVRSIKLPDLSFTVDIDKTTHVPVFSEASYNQEITIDWFEDVYHSIWKYHDDWMRRWYDKTFNVLRCGVAGKFRKLDLMAYHYKINSDSIFSSPAPEPIFLCKIGGMVPTSLPGQKYDYSNDGNDELLSITYKCARIDFRYNENFTNASNSLYDSTDKAESGLSGVDVWSANGISGEGVGRDDSMTLEKLRIARASTTRYDSMPVYS